MELISHEQLCFFYSPDDSLLQFFDDRNIENDYKEAIKRAKKNKNRPKMPDFLKPKKKK